MTGCDVLKTGLNRIAASLEARRSAVLELWRDAVTADPTLDSTSEWSIRQFDDHFPDVLDALIRSLRDWPDPSTAAGSDEQALAVLHARARWLQGYSLRGVVREWGHFNAVVVDQMQSCPLEDGAPQREIHRAASAVWAQLLNEQQTLSALEYHNLERAEAQTRATELTRVLEQIRGFTSGRGRLLEGIVATMRNDLQLVMTSTALSTDAMAWDQAYELRKLSEDGLRGLEQALKSMVTLAELEAGQEVREVTSFDAGSALELLCEGLRHVVAQEGAELTWRGPESFVVEGDPERVRRLTRHLVLCALQTPGDGGIAVRWSFDPASSPRWQVEVERALVPAPETSVPAVGLALAVSTEAAQEIEGRASAGRQHALQNGEIAAAEDDGIDLLIAKQLCSILSASLELEAQGERVRYRATLPLAYSTPAAHS
ncbi:RsbRD N-terminal domain-containing protein [Cognatilysobacter bugurensis]|uniref:Uncharacterized protein n=1 Tax=Cognatilysobacter bugurensis TaxID=543356 RepID=A0A918WAL7_9GAMM|nr:RsbRD N-terminal domain-containing protein [Lysobacter bugurensis]GHA84065.1 hypothetical protein GCM10007067_22820 [Lysobacter bugurensis]